MNFSLFKILIAFLILTKFFHYNSLVFYKIYLFYNLEQVLAEADTSALSYSGFTVNVIHFIDMISIDDLLLLSPLIFTVNETLSYPGSSNIITFKFEYGGKPVKVRQPFFVPSSQWNDDIIEGFTKNNGGRIFINPAAPESEVFIFKPRPDEKESFRLFHSTLLCFFLLLGLFSRGKTKQVAYTFSAFFAGCLVSLLDRPVVYLICIVLATIYFLGLRFLMIVIKKLRKNKEQNLSP